MKVKVVLTKGFKNSKISRTLNLGNRNHSKTAESSIKDLNLPATNNNIATKKINEKNSKSKSKNKQQTNSKKKITHTEIQAKEKSLDKNISQIEQNHILNKINEYKNSTITNSTPYQKINELQEKKRKLKARENSYSNLPLKKYSFKTNYNYTNCNDKNKNIYFRTPIKIKKLGRSKDMVHKINIHSKLNNQYICSYLNDNENSFNNNTSVVLNLQKELECLKRENLMKAMLVANMKQQIEECKNQQKIIEENHLLKEEIEFLKSNFKSNDINKNNEKLRESNNDKMDLFDKLKNEYFNSQNQVNELMNQNKKLKEELNKLNEKSVKREIEINIIGKANDKNNVNKTNKNNNSQGNNNFNNYIENKYKLILAKEKEDINNYNKPLKDEQKDKIRFLIKMTLNSNNIQKDKILHFIINNLTNLNDIINSIITDFLKTNSTFDKVLLRHYLTSICYENKNKTFNINNLFNEINYYYNGIEKIKQNIQKIHHFISNNENIKQLINECKFKDQFNVGIIELNQFNEIFIGAYGNYVNNEKNRDLYDLLIFAMKNYYNLSDLGLYHLCYLNLDYETFQQKLSNSNRIKNVNNKDNDNLGKNEHESHDIFSNNYYNNINSSNSENNSCKYSNKNQNLNSNEDVFADVSINVEQSTALVNVKFKNHYDSDCDNNSVVQTSINGINSNVNNEEDLSKNDNNEDDDEEENILFTNEDTQVCIDFVTNIFDYCMKKIQKEKNQKNCSDDIVEK